MNLLRGTKIRKINDLFEISSHEYRNTRRERERERGRERERATYYDETRVQRR